MPVVNQSFQMLRFDYSAGYKRIELCSGRTDSASKCI